MIPVQLIAAVVIATAAFGSGWKVRDWKAGAQRTAETEREMQVLAARSRTVDAAATRHEKFKAAAQVRYEVVTIKEVERVTQDPVYRNVCISPDGLRIVADEIAARNATASKPAPAVSGAGGTQ